MEKFNMEWLIKILEMDEGLELTLYKDTLNYYTIGIGHLLTKENSMTKAIEILDEQVGRSTGGHITKEEAYSLFKQDIKNTLDLIEKSSIINPVFESLSPIRRLGLISMVYQMGIRGVEGFKNSLKFMSEGKWDMVERNLKLSLWYKQTPNRALRVVNIIARENLRPYRIQQ